MNSDKEYLLDKLLSRIDYYINTVNSKAAFIISFDTFILGTIILKYKELINSFTYEKFKFVIPVVLLFVIIGVSRSLYLVFKAVNPYVDSGNRPTNYHSLLFFGSVGEMKYEDYSLKVDELDSETIEKDLKYQTHTLSIELSKKFKYISKSMFWILWFVLFPLVLISLIKVVEWFLI